MTNEETVKMLKQHTYKYGEYKVPKEKERPVNDCCGLFHGVLFKRKCGK